jgi:2-octaprenyl-6-methoxyphenol hydroxylase
MNVCIIGDGLTSLSLAKILIKKKINVHIYHQKKNITLIPSRTIGITENNISFLKKENFQFSKKYAWEIKRIEIYTEKLKSNKILNFENNNNKLFFMIKNDEFYKKLNKQLIDSKFFKRIKIKNNNVYKKLLKDEKYDLIINCDTNNILSKKFFSKKINKDYGNIAFTTILKHKKLINNTATQVFTKLGPVAYLPISNSETSIVCSLEVKNKKYTDNEIINLIKDNNNKYKIKKFMKLNKFKLQSSILRNYYYKNILAFGDLLHKVHPLAGQGFNITIRDIKVLSKIIQNRIDLGMQLDPFIFEEFEKKTKHSNFIFSSGIDFIYEFFNFDKKNNNKNLNKILRYIGKNKNLNNTFIKLADNGLNI